MADMIRILRFIPGFLFGGIESSFLAHYSRFDKEKICLELLLRTQDDDIDTLGRYREMGGTYYRLKKLSPGGILSYIHSVREFFRLHHNYDILHAHGADPFVFYYAKKWGIRHIILHAHTTADSEGEKYKLLKKCLRIASLFL